MFNVINLVVDNLFIGNINALHPSILHHYDIKAVISVIGRDVNIVYPNHINHLRINIDDHESENIEPWLEPVYQFIDAHRMKKMNVLVHCHAGISRSATMVLYYLMKYFKVPLRIAFGHLRKKDQSSIQTMALCIL